MILVLCEDIERRAEMAGRLRSRLVSVWAPPPCDFQAEAESSRYSAVVFVLPLPRELLFCRAPMRFKIAVGGADTVLPDDTERFEDPNSPGLGDHLADIERSQPPEYAGEFCLDGSSVYAFGYPLKLNPEEFAVIARLITVGRATADELFAACSDKIYSKRKAPRLNNNISAVISRINKMSREITGRRMIARRGDSYYVIGSEEPTEKIKKRD